MKKTEEARQLYNVQAVRKASNINLDSDRIKYSVSAVIDADFEQAVWENYIRNGKTNAFPSKVIIA